MKAFVLAEPGKVQWYNAPEPELPPYGAILEPIAVTPCSSDVHTVFGGGSPKLIWFWDMNQLDALLQSENTLKTSK